MRTSVGPPTSRRAPPGRCADRPYSDRRAVLTRNSLNEIKEVLASMGLRLGMDIPGWPPEDIEEMAKKLEHEMLG